VSTTVGLKGLLGGTFVGLYYFRWGVEFYVKEHVTLTFLK